MKNVNLKKAWIKFDQGDSLTTPEIMEMIASAEQGIEFLANRGETGGVMFKAALNLASLKDYLYARRNHL